MSTWYRNPTSDEWGPELTKALTEAYEEAHRRARTLGITSGRNGEPVSETIAQYIIARAKRGEYEPKALADGAVAYLQQREHGV